MPLLRRFPPSRRRASSSSGGNFASGPAPRARGGLRGTSSLCSLSCAPDGAPHRLSPRPWRRGSQLGGSRSAFGRPAKVCS
eukprot:7247754-Alexandrium_andersonii.AAC.1